MKFDSLLDKISFLLKTAKEQRYDQEAFNIIKIMTEEHSDNAILGRFFGYTVSDYAYATLKWLNTPETNELFVNLFNLLPSNRKQEINELIDKKLYLEIK